MSSNNKNTKSGSGNLLNVIIAVVIVAFLVLAGFAIAPSIKNMTENYKASQPVEIETVEKYAKAHDLSVEDFLAEYGLTDNEQVTKDTPISNVIFSMTLDNVAKFKGITLDELKTHYGLDAAVEGTKLYSDVQMDMKAGAVVEDFNMDFASFAEQAQLPAEYTAESKWSEIVLYSQMLQAEAEASAAETTPAEGDITVTTEATTEATETAEAPATTEAPAAE